MPPSTLLKPLTSSDKNVKESSSESKKSNLKSKTGTKEINDVTRVNKFKLQFDRSPDEQLVVRFADEEVKDQRQINSSLEKPRGGPEAYQR